MAAKTYLEWPVENRIYLTLDLECDYGTAISENVFRSAAETHKLVPILEDNDVPLSCFVQTQLLDEHPSYLVPLVDASVPVEFHPHSHTHPKISNADVSMEVAESVSRVREQFDTNPLGFRFPDGAAKSQDYAILDDHGVDFSATLFPSWRPGRFNNSREPRVPFIHHHSGVLELPFTVYSNYLRIPISLSYLKLFGRVYERLIRAGSPNVIIFDLHMHDLDVPETFSHLPRLYQAIYARRKHAGADILDRFIQSFQQKEYSFGQITDLYCAVKEDGVHAN